MTEIQNMEAEKSKSQERRERRAERMLAHPPVQGRKGSGIANTAVAILVLVFLSVVVQKVITNMTADGHITGLSATVAPYVVPMMWIGGLVLAAKMAARHQ